MSTRRKAGKITRVAIAVAAIAVGGLLVAAPAQAQQARYQIVNPNPYIAPPQPYRLGLYGHIEYGRGMVVDHVPWGPPAGPAWSRATRSCGSMAGGSKMTTTTSRPSATAEACAICWSRTSAAEG